MHYSLSPGHGFWFFSVCLYINLEIWKKGRRGSKRRLNGNMFKRGGGSKIFCQDKVGVEGTLS